MKLPTIVIRNDVLESWLMISDYSKSRLAGELGISKGRISQLLTSRQEPSAHLIAKLITLTYLPFHRLFKIVHDKQPDGPSLRSARQTGRGTAGNFVTSTRKTVLASTSGKRRHSRRIARRSRLTPSSLKGVR